MRQNALKIGFVFLYTISLFLVGYLISLNFEIYIFSQSIGIIAILTGVLIRLRGTQKAPIVKHTFSFLIFITPFLALGFAKAASQPTNPQPVANCIDETKVDKLYQKFKSTKSITTYPGLLSPKKCSLLNVKETLKRQELKRLNEFFDNEFRNQVSENCSLKKMKGSILPPFEEKIEDDVDILLNECAYCTGLSNAINKYLESQDEQDLSRAFIQYDLSMANIIFIDSTLGTPFGSNESFYDYLKNNTVNSVQSINILRREKSQNTEKTQKIIFTKN